MLNLSGRPSNIKRNEPRRRCCRRGSCSSASCDQDADDEEDDEAREPAGLVAEQVQQDQPGEDGEAYSRSPSGAERCAASSLPTSRISRLKASGSLGDDLGHRAVLAKGPGFRRPRRRERWWPSRRSPRARAPGSRSRPRGARRPRRTCRSRPFRSPDTSRSVFG
jgi:hypothetical protein